MKVVSRSIDQFKGGQKKHMMVKRKLKKTQKRIQAKTLKLKQKVILNLGFIWKILIGDCDFYSKLIFSI